MLINLKEKMKTFLSLTYAAGALFLVTAMLIWPQETFQAATYGLELWATVLVPSLLPFFIIAEILLNLGIVSLVGVLLEPVMRPLFNLPGSASFVVAMGFTSGYPMGAVLTRRLYEEKECTLTEGERLVAFTNNSSPLFIMVAVSVGMFDNPLLGIILAAAHYTSNIIWGIILGWFAPRQPVWHTRKENIFIHSIRSLLAAQKKRKPWGKLLGDAISGGISNITLIAGFVIIFAVIIRILLTTNLLYYPTCFIGFLLKLFHFDPDLRTAFAAGFWEMTLGLHEVSQLKVSLQEKAIAASIILGWSGLSIQAQVASVLSGSGIKVRHYFQGRFVQGLLSGIISYLLIRSSESWAPLVPIPVSTFKNESVLSFGTLLSNLGYVGQTYYILLKFFLILLLASFLVYLSRKIHAKI